MSFSPDTEPIVPSPARRRRWRWRWRLRWIFPGLLVAAFTALVVMADVGARRLITPRRWPLAPAHEAMVKNPADFGLTLRPFPVRTADGLTLRALIAEPALKAGRTDRGARLLAAMRSRSPNPAPWKPGQPPRGTVVLLHGLSGRKEFLLPVAERFAAVGFRSILFDSRAHGESGGTYATFGTHEVDDAARVLEAAQEKCGSLGPVSVFGYSMGAAVALQWLPQMEKPAAAVLVAPFADLESVVQLRAHEHLGGCLAHAFPLLRACVRCRAGFDPAAVSPERQLAAWKAAAPVLLVHGAQDGIIPAEHSRRLGDLLSARHDVHTLIVPSADHGNVIVKGGDALFAAAVATFLGRK